MSFYKQFSKLFVAVVALTTTGSVSAETNPITAHLNGAPVGALSQTFSELAEMNLVILGDPARRIDLYLENESQASAIAKLAVQLTARITRYPHIVILSDNDTAERLKELEGTLSDDNLISMTLRDAPLRELLEVLDRLTGEDNSARLARQIRSGREETRLISLRLIEVPASEVKAILSAFYGLDLTKLRRPSSPHDGEKSSSRRDSSKVSQSKAIVESDSH